MMDGDMAEIWMAGICDKKDIWGWIFGIGGWMDNHNNNKCWSMDVYNVIFAVMLEWEIDYICHG